MKMGVLNFLLRLLSRPTHSVLTLQLADVAIAMQWLWLKKPKIKAIYISNIKNH